MAVLPLRRSESGAGPTALAPGLGRTITMCDRVYRFSRIAQQDSRSLPRVGATGTARPMRDRKENALHLNRVTTSAATGALALTIASAVLPVSAQASEWTPTNNPGVTVWQHGGSNMGECSAYLASTLGVRDDINHAIQEFGPLLGLSSPGALYSVRAQQQVNGAPADECLPRQLPGGGTG